jgi:hypothetical protein
MPFRRRTSFWRYIGIVCICAWTIVPARIAHAQCDRNPGDFLIGEDERNYYCGSPASSSDMQETLRDIRNYLTKPPPDELLGARWRFRKGVIDTAGCVARNHAAYSFGAKYSVLDECTNGQPIDCSGLAAYAYRVSACFVRGFYSAKDEGLRRLEDNADGQASFFKAHGAWMDRTATPSPGDAVFFCCTYRPVPPRDITHVAIYLGRRNDGTMMVIQAVGAGVKIQALSPELAGKIQGFGNAGALHKDLTGIP